MSKTRASRYEALETFETFKMVANVIKRLLKNEKLEVRSIDILVKEWKTCCQ